MNILIRKISENDCNDIWKIEKDCFSDHHSKDSFRRELNNPLCAILAAFDENIPVGFINVWFVAGELTINNIAVIEKYRRQGIAEKLINAALELYPQTESAMLEVRASNAAAQKLYEKLDFIKVGVRKSYYSDPKEDALLMTKTIGGKK
ncbi:ribosomal protein S18-alanine N-acetyltransferase [Ruminococcus sp. Marseille-P6503]|uniref:ribosomal protein S18-alanine N-acetyltransferase n=1 Tax=Ruminococcus sp. Marseille-P6503 TaxID=2364796 RepID=UPI0013DE2207|nr:ribosomal protein S18-alanine N-acetyltransferase [Ruminococcus sp. Marseille-P6503]